MGSNDVPERKGFISGPHNARPLPAAGGILLADGRSTGGSFTLIESRVSGRDKTPLHVHHDMDECFYILEGHYTVVCGDDVFEAPAGTFVFMPRGVPHSYEAGPQGGAKIILGVPGGLEEFFDDMDADVDWQELGRRHKITFMPE